MNFRISGISPEPFRPLFALDDAALAALGAKRCIAEDATGYPCRVSLAHAAPGEELILLSYVHQDTGSPYRAAGPIFVRKSADKAFNRLNVVPEPVRTRLLSVRAYDSQDLIVDAEVVDGGELETPIARFFGNQAAYLHIHYARRGCFACRVDRA